MAFEYGADGKRRQRLAGTDETWYNWGLGYAVLSEADGTGALTRTYVGGTLAHMNGAAPGSGTYVYYGHDHLGSTRALYDASKNETGRFEYSPYGAALATSNADATSRRYTGHDWDADTALYFAPFRYYSPAAGRWITRDPLGMVDGPNVYAYVRNAPITFTDPLGLAIPAVLGPLAGAGAIGGIGGGLAGFGQGLACGEDWSDVFRRAGRGAAAGSIAGVAIAGAAMGIGALLGNGAAAGAASVAVETAGVLLLLELDKPETGISTRSNFRRQSYGRREACTQAFFIGGQGGGREAALGGRRASFRHL